MKGPCLCGDIACPSCGTPGAVEFEAAMEWASEQFAGLAPDEIRLAVEVGTLAAKRARDYAESLAATALSIEREVATGRELKAISQRAERQGGFDRPSAFDQFDQGGE